MGNIRPYQRPPEPLDTATKQNAIAWREHSIYLSAQSDLAHTLLDLFDNQMNPELKSYCQQYYQQCKEEADAAHDKAVKISISEWSREKGVN